MKAFETNIPEHIAVYGPDNHLRLTGLHETQAIDKFSYGLSDRGASIRLPINFIKNGYKGYLEDRRPNSEGDPYQIVSRILKTINSVPKPVASKAMGLGCAGRTFSHEDNAPRLTRTAAPHPRRV